MRNLGLLGGSRGGHRVTCRFLDYRKLSTGLRHLEFECVFAVRDFLDGDPHTHPGVAHLGFGSPVPRVTFHCSFRFADFAATGELMVGVDPFVRVIPLLLRNSD